MNPFFIMILSCVAAVSLPAAEAIGAGHEYDGVKIVEETRSTQKVLPAELQLGTALRPFVPALFGVSIDFECIAPVKIAIPAGDDQIPRINPEFLEMAKGIPFPLTRITFPYRVWPRMIGPLGRRQPVIVSATSRGKILAETGPAEIIRALLQIDPRARFCVQLALRGADYLAETQKIAEFLLGDPQTEWGRKRLESGLPQSVPVALWEFGNEEDWQKERLTVEEYIARCRELIKVLRRYDARALFAPHAATAPWHPTQTKIWKNWHKKILEALAKDIHCLAFHPYYRGLPPFTLDGYMKSISQDVAASANPHIQFYISEHGVWPEGEPGPWKNSWYKTHALSGCLAVGEWFNIRAADLSTGYMTMHCLRSGPWKMFDRAKNGKLHTSGLAELFRLYGMLPRGGKILRYALSGEDCEYSAKMSLSALPVRADDGTLSLIITNRLPETARAIALPAGLTLSAVKVLTAESPKSVNDEKNRPIAIREAEVPQGRVYTAPARSVSLLTFKPVPAR